MIRERRGLHPFDILSAGCLLLLLITLGLSRVGPTDTAWHLATAREAWRTGAWPLVNTFSYSFPEYPLYQQYPLYQGSLYAVYLAFGFEGLSIFALTAFLIMLFLLRQFAATPLACAPLLWLLVILGLQQRMVLRPFVFSFPLFLLLLLALIRLRDARENRTAWTSVLCVLVLQYVWILSHQLYLIGLFMQLGLLASHLLARLGVRFGTERSGTLAVFPLLTCILLSFALVAATPLGIQGYVGLLKTFEGAEYLRGHVHELRPLSAQPYALALVLLGVLSIIYGYWRNPKSFCVFELGTAALLLCIALVGWRGVAFFVPYAAALGIRNSATVSTTTPPFFRTLRTAVLAAALILAVQVRFFPPLTPLEGQQAGIGKAIGQWSDATMAHVQATQPAGRGMNLSWYLGNVFIWNLFPQYQVLVDPRTEAYPRSFIEEVFRAVEDQAVFDSLLARYEVSWFLGEVRIEQLWWRARALLDSGHWRLAFVDPVSFLLVRNAEQQSPETIRAQARNAFRSVVFSAPEALAEAERTRLEDFERVLLAEE